MIIVLKKNADQNTLAKLKERISVENVSIQTIEGSHSNVIGIIGDTSAIDVDRIQALDIVESIKRIQDPYKKVNRKFHPDDSVIDLGCTRIGGGNFAIMAGPCSVESEEQLCTIAEAVKASGATVLRGGAFKPRTSPYAFQGMRAEGIRLLLEAKKLTGLPIVTEVMDISQLELFDDIDIIQVGARNMQNFELLKELGKINKPILLKRGLSATIQELLMSAEYILAGGNSQVILCERGIRTFETATRNTLDVSAVPVLKEKTHLPIIVDPSHSTGYSKYVSSMTMAAVAAGADGIMVEVHNDPAHALCDGQQSITPEAFKTLTGKISRLLPVVHDIYCD